MLVEPLEFIGDVADAILDAAQLGDLARQLIDLLGRLFVVGEELA